jgi:hypothetical protein
MKRWLFAILGSVIASVLVLYFPQGALAQNYKFPGSSTGQMKKIEKSNTTKQDQKTSTKEQAVFIGKTYNVDFADRAQGNYFTAHFNFPSTNALKWQYYWDNSPQGPLNALELRNNSDRTLEYHGKRNDENGGIEESIFSISFSEDFSTFEGIGEFIWHLKNGEINNRQYTIKGQKINR